MFMSSPLHGSMSVSSSSSLVNSRDSILKLILQIDKDVEEHGRKELQDINLGYKSTEIRMSKLDKWIKFTNGNLPPNQQTEYDQIQGMRAYLDDRLKNFDKELAEYREGQIDFHETDIEFEVENIKNTLTEYLGKATPLAITQYNLMLKREAGWRSRIKAIDNTSAPEKPIKPNAKPKIGGLFFLCWLIAFIPLFFVVSILVAGVAVVLFGDSPPNLLIFAVVIAGFSSWKLLRKMAIHDAEKKAAISYEKAIRNWEIEVKEYNAEKGKLREETVEKLKSVQPLLELYRKRDVTVVEEFITVALKDLPKINHNNPIISVSFSNSSVIVDYLLPDIDDIRELPIDVAIKRGNISLSYFKDSQLSKVYNKLVYDIILAVMNCVFNHDEVEAIESVTVNGILDTVDKSVGKPIRICACSLQMNREEFKELNLELIDSYECFRRFKGIAAANIADKVAINPIQKIQDKDTRFVEGYSVASELQRGTNLATMPWQDFENLIRELFEKLFSKHGGSCKVTRASRDGGVDAVAFNPDPISGGKFIIQAKRYTNLVSPSAVRDLYGTLQHEGANKAILVTTSDYGGDSYSFAKDKPIQLLNGSHLLHYLKEELGMTDVYINLDEAKKLNKEN